MAGGKGDSPAVFCRSLYTLFTAIPLIRVIRVFRGYLLSHLSPVCLIAAVGTFDLPRIAFPKTSDYPECDMVGTTICRL